MRTKMTEASSPIMDTEDPEFRRELRKQYRALHQEARGTLSPCAFARPRGRIIISALRSTHLLLRNSFAGRKDAYIQPNSSSLLEMVKKADALHKNGTSLLFGPTVLLRKKRVVQIYTFFVEATLTDFPSFRQIYGQELPS